MRVGILDIQCYKGLLALKQCHKWGAVGKHLRFFDDTIDAVAERLARGFDFRTEKILVWPTPTAL